MSPHQRGDSPLRTPSHHARGDDGGAAEAQGRARDRHRHGRPGRADPGLPGGGGRGARSAWSISTRSIISNLHRQIIHKTGNVGKLKTQSAVEMMKEINPLIDIKTYETSLRSDNALELLRDYDIVIDGTDNFPRAIWSTTPARCWTSRTSTARSSASRARPPFSGPRKGRAIAAFFPSRRSRARCRVARRAACSACCRAWSARSRRPRR